VYVHVEEVNSCCYGCLQSTKSSQQVAAATLDGPADVHSSQPDNSSSAAVSNSSSGDYEAGYIAPHPGMRTVPLGTNITGGVPTDVHTVMRNPVYTKEYMESIVPKHLPPQTVRQAAIASALCVAVLFDSIVYHLDVWCLIQRLLQPASSLQ
jgi:hypothetical protein